MHALFVISTLAFSDPTTLVFCHARGLPIGMPLIQMGTHVLLKVISNIVDDPPIAAIDQPTI